MMFTLLLSSTLLLSFAHAQWLHDAPASTTQCNFPFPISSIWRECECLPSGVAHSLHVMCRGLSVDTVPPLPHDPSPRGGRPPITILALSITDGALTNLQQDGFKQHDMQTLDFTNNHIQTVNVNAFRGLEKRLYKLILKQNNLSVVPSWSLTYLSQLQFLHLEHNRITHVRANTFDETQLNNLQFLHLDHNQITFIPNLSFHRLRLIVLTLSNNRISELEKLSLPPSLGFLDLKNNLLDKIPYLALQDLSSIQSLSLEGNNITSLDGHDEILFKNELKLNLRNNKIRKLTNASFKSFRKFKELDLSYNQIGKIHARAFSGVSQCRELDLSYNQVVHIPAGAFNNFAKNLAKLNLEENQMHTLPDALSELRALTHLNLNGNKLNELDASIMSQTKNTLTELLVAYNHLSAIPSDVLNGMSKLQHLDLSKNRISSLDKLAFGTFDGSGTSLVMLNLAGNHLRSIADPAVFLYMTALAYLDLSYNRIDEIGHRAFEKLPGLESLFLQNNHLSEYPQNALTIMSKLRHLVLDNNAIETLPPYSAGTMARLERLSLSGNHISNITDKTFHTGSCGELRSVNLAHNNIDYVSTRAFSQLDNIQQVLLSHNKIGAVRPLTFADLKNIKQIDLSNNEITRVAPGSFTNLPQLEIISLHHNKLEHLERDAFSKVNRIEIFDVSNNNLRSFDCQSLSYAQTITNLDVSFNRISSLELSCVKRSLLKLDLSHNELQTIGRETMRDFDQLRYLSLSHNGLLDVHTTAFHACPRLTHLDLSNNHMRNVWKSTFSTQDLLHHIDLSHNALIMLHSDTFGKNNVLSLSLAHNEFSSFPLSSLGSVANSLSSLSMAHNQLTSITSAIFSGLRNLTQLDLSHNHIDSIEEAAFEHLPALRHLDLSNNPITTWNPAAFSLISPSIQSLNLASTGLFSMPRFTQRGLRSLNISHNKIFDMSRHDLSPLSKLTELDIAYNNIQLLPTDAFADLHDLKHLNISGNQLTHLTDAHFKTLYQLEKLSLCSLHALVRLPEAHSWSQLTNMRELDMHGVSTARPYNVSDILAALPPLSKLHVEIVEDILDTQLHRADMRLMRHLTVTGARLRDIDIGAFYLLRGYRVELAIEHTQLATFPAAIFNTLTGVNFLSLRLAHNRLTHFHPFRNTAVPVINQHGTVLQELHLAGNPLHCDCSMQWLSDWLRLSHSSSSPSSASSSSPSSSSTLPLSDVYCQHDPHKHTVREVYLPHSQLITCAAPPRATLARLTTWSIIIILPLVLI